MSKAIVLFILSSMTFSLDSCFGLRQETKVPQNFPHDVESLSSMEIQMLEKEIVWASHHCIRESLMSKSEKSDPRKRRVKTRIHALCLTKYIRDDGSPRLYDWTITACINSPIDNHIQNITLCVRKRLASVSKLIEP